MIIKCKAVYINKLMIRMVIATLFLVLTIFFTLPGKWDYLSIYTLSAFIGFPLLVYVFYRNRFELLVIGIEGENVHLSFVNNSIYKRKDIKTVRSNMVVEQKEDMLLFSLDNELRAILRKSAVGATDWDKVVQTFAKPQGAGIA